MKRLPYLLAAAGLVLAAGSGFLASRAFGTSSQATRTVTINIPTVPPSGLTCPTGFSPADVVVNHPGGQTVLFTCVKD
jgi:hypothetical protein